MQFVPSQGWIMSANWKEPPPDWKATPCKRVGKLLGGWSHNLACQGLAFLSPDGFTLLLEGYLNIAEASRTMFSILAGQVLPFKEKLNWLNFTYTSDQKRAYVALVSLVLAWSTVLEGDPLFQALWKHLLQRYLGADVPVPDTDMLFPL